MLPILAKQPTIRIWHAGCATGEEVYSMAILLQEAGLLRRALLYATDLNEVVIERAKEGISPLDQMRQNTINYQQAGGTACFSDYYTARYESAIMDPSLARHMVFAQHNLATDSSFGEMDLIVCRNVLIYFNRALQDRAIGLFAESLSHGGVLCLGSRESVRFCRHAEQFEELIPGEQIYEKGEMNIQQGAVRRAYANE